MQQMIGLSARKLCSVAVVLMICFLFVSCSCGDGGPSRQKLDDDDDIDIDDDGGGDDDDNDSCEDQCNGDILTYCLDDTAQTIDCSADNMTCAENESGKVGCVPIDEGEHANAEESEEFLLIPFDGEIDVLTGWDHNNPNFPFGEKFHGAIDFSLPATVDLYSPCDGMAMTSSDDSLHGGYGDFVLVRCDQTDPQGLNYFVLLSPVKDVNENIKQYSASQRGNTNYGDWTAVTVNDRIACNDDKASDPSHLHFEVMRGGFGLNRTDPYDLYQPTSVAADSADFYPPNGTQFTACGDNPIWSTCPPQSIFGPYLKVLSPEEGDVLVQGETYSFTWYSRGMPHFDPVYIKIFKGAGHDGMDDAECVECPGDNDQVVVSFTIDPEKFAPGDDYYLGIYDEFHLAYDWGDYFTIAAP